MVEHGTENAGVPSSILGLSTTWIDSELDDNVGLFWLWAGSLKSRRRQIEWCCASLSDSGMGLEVPPTPLSKCSFTGNHCATK